MSWCGTNRPCWFIRSTILIVGAWPRRIPQGLVTTLHDKQPGLPAPVDALIGVYYFPDLELLRAAARQAVATAEDGRSADGNGGNSEQCRPASSPLQGGAGRRLARLRQPRPASQFASHAVAKTGVQRAVDRQHVRHRYQVEPLRRQVPGRNQLPPAPATRAVGPFPARGRLFDRLGRSLADDGYYGYPTLAEVFVFENVDPAIWEQVFVHLRDIVVGRVHARRRPLAAGVLEEMYLGKTRRRLAGITEPAGPAGISDPRGAGRDQRSRRWPICRRLWKSLEGEVERLADNVQGCVVHGDLCLSNILYDMRSRICKLIDPRGSFGPAGIYGDPRYDVAKLYHSVYGLYDFIVNDLFHVSVEGNRIDLDIRHRPQHREIQKRFEKVFFSEFDLREILLLTGLLFASMPALHYDAPNRQLAMYARALELFAELFLLSLSSSSAGVEN